MARRDREINIFNIAFLDVITGAMGAFVLLVVMLSTYVNRAQQDTQVQQVQQAEQDADEARKERDELQQKLDQQTQQTAKEALDRAEKNIEQADQAMQTEDVEELKRLLAQARADLAEARQQLEQLSQELQQTQRELQQTQQELKKAEDANEVLQERLNQAVAEVQDLKKKLDAANQQRDQALQSAEQARQQVAGLQDTLSHSEPSSNSWAFIDISALPSCGNLEFFHESGQYLTGDFKQPMGFTDKNEQSGYVNRGSDAKLIQPTINVGTLFHKQWFIPIQTGTRGLFGVRPRGAPPPGCLVKYDLSYTTRNGDNLAMNTSGNTVAVTGAQPVLLIGLPPGPQGGVPTPQDISIWQRQYSAGGAAK